jgi:hypothetical protein
MDSMPDRDLHRLADIASLHAICPNKFNFGSGQIYFRLSVTEHMNMRRFVIVGENDNAQTMFSKDRDHVQT